MDIPPLVDLQSVCMSTLQYVPQIFLRLLASLAQMHLHRFLSWSDVLDLNCRHLARSDVCVARVLLPLPLRREWHVR